MNTIWRVLTAMRPIVHGGTLFESEPPLFEFGSGPLPPSCVNELIPLDVIFRVEVQLRNPRRMVRK
jgi:hypothetical protein